MKNMKKILRFAMIMAIIVLPVFLFQNGYLGKYSSFLGFDTGKATRFNMVSVGDSIDKVIKFLDEPDYDTVALDLEGLSVNKNLLELNKNIAVEFYYYWENKSFVYILGMNHREEVVTKYIAEVIPDEEDEELDEE